MSDRRRRRPTVITVANGDPTYARGLSRLRTSLTAVGFDGHLRCWEDDLPAGCPPHHDVPFAFKPACFVDARRDHDPVLWMDSSCIAVRALDPIYEQMRTDGYVLFKNRDYRVGQWLSDAALDYFNLGRDDAMELPEVNAAAIGLDLGSPIGNAFLDQWHAAADAGLPFRGVVEIRGDHDYHDVKWNTAGRVSSDPRVRGHRHDQSAAGIIAHRLGMRLTPTGVHTADGRPVEPPPNTVVVIDRNATYPLRASAR